MSVPEESSSTEMRDPAELEILRYANDNLIVERDALKARLLYAEDALKQIEEIAHSHSSGPTVPDVYWEIRAIAQSAL